MRHNKKRNTAFLFEALIAEMTKAVVRGDLKAQARTRKIIAKHFKKGTALYEELQLYKAILETRGLDKIVAEKLIFEVKAQRKYILDGDVFKEQSELIQDMNQEYKKAVFSNFVPNYKNLATLHQVFNNLDLSAKERVLLEEEAIQLMVEAKQEVQQKDLKHIDNLVFKSFVDRFNKEYSGLLEEQKTLLSRFIASGVGNNLEFQMYLNDEIGRLKEELSSAQSTKEFKEDGEMLEKANQVLNLLETFSQKPLEEGDLKRILKIQELAREIKN